MFNTTAKTQEFGLIPGNEYTVYAVVPNGYETGPSFLVTINGDYRLVSAEYFTATKYKKF